MSFWEKSSKICSIVAHSVQPHICILNKSLILGNLEECQQPSLQPLLDHKFNTMTGCPGDWNAGYRIPPNGRA